MLNNKKLFITGIGTGIGKTIVAAILTEALKADYWKPIQSGDLEQSDTLKVKSLISNSQTVFHPEAYRLTQPYSPHKSAKLDAITIDINKINAPQIDNTLVIEGAGGLMVPLNDDDLMIDLIKKLDTEVILVSQNYLGSINHTLLSVEALKARDIPIAALIFNGERDEYSEEVILKMTGIQKVFFVPRLSTINNQEILKASSRITLF